VNDIDDVQLDPNKLNGSFEVQAMNDYFELSSIKVKDFTNYGIAYYDSHDH